MVVAILNIKFRNSTCAMASVHVKKTDKVDKAVRSYIANVGVKGIWVDGRTFFPPHMIESISYEVASSL